MSLPTVAPGILAAFWALGTNIGTIGWPDCGEADYGNVSAFCWTDHDRQSHIDQAGTGQD